jgi:hypothetical protein
MGRRSVEDTVRGVGFLFGDRVEVVPVKLYEVRWSE